ncbi:MAG: hypothetical protein ACKVI4_13525 [Actinomycetales bacterium]
MMESAETGLSEVGLTYDVTKSWALIRAVETWLLQVGEFAELLRKKEEVLSGTPDEMESVAAEFAGTMRLIKDGYPEMVRNGSVREEVQQAIKDMQTRGNWSDVERLKWLAKQIAAMERVLS